MLVNRYFPPPNTEESYALWVRAGKKTDALLKDDSELSWESIRQALYEFAMGEIILCPPKPEQLVNAASDEQEERDIRATRDRTRRLTFLAAMQKEAA